MSRQISQPVNQVRLTNVAIVRMTSKQGKRFEIACYRNKIVNYRQGLETDLSEVLQTERVFANVSKGLFASSKDLQAAFQTTDQRVICKLLLDRGEIQVSDLEREATLESTLREVATMVAEKCVHPLTQRQYTVQQIRDAMKRSEFVVQSTATRSVKQQFLDCVKAIQRSQVIPLERAKMEVAIVLTVDSWEYSACDRKEEQERGTASTPVTLLQRHLEQLCHDLEQEAQVTFVTRNHSFDEENVDTAAKMSRRIHVYILPQFYKTIESIVHRYHQSKQITSGYTLSVHLEIVQQVVALTEHPMDDDTTGTDFDRLSHAFHNHLHLANPNTQDLPSTQPSHHRDESQQEQNSRILSSGMLSTQHLQQDPQLRNLSLQDHRNKEKDVVLESSPSQSLHSKQCQLSSSPPAVDRIQKHHDTAQGEERHGLEEQKNPREFKSCNTCGGSFTVSQYRAHFKCDWHRYNQKLRLKGLLPISEREFQSVDSDAFFHTNLE